jgi:RNA polymerase sigma-70 factor (ECF subfamily)
MMNTASIALNGLPFRDEAARRLRAGPVAQPPGITPDADATMELVRRARSGDQAAIDDLFIRYEARLRRWAHGRLPSAARGALETQDLVQDTLVKVFQRLHAFEPRHAGAFREYVWTTLWNSVRDLARTYRRRGPADPIDGDLPAHGPSPLELAVGAEVVSRYEAALDRLRPEDREAIVARIELGLSLVEVAHALGKPSAAAAHMAVSRALVRLAQEMAHVRKLAR